METYRLAYTNGADITIFDSAETVEAVSLADDFDKRHGSSATTLWVRQSDGSWAAVERRH
ncbi:hypothetical protein AB0280_01140 [Pseudarthrobacter sp902506025]|uniref:Uncharacterized protein n=1 Tax=Pseudarthrobacter defluvii TaxID=410837 RepID=A0ABT9UN04_9MICC|nr:hypothetical protein [Pseudarthrobacter defluvii]MDQ0121025.1 hypothetical protein [Pseudarthrobacter defluvii]